MLFEHQKQLIDESPLYTGLWWEVGTGKTLTAIRLAEKNGNSCLVVCPKSLKMNWYREVKKWGERDDFEWRICTKETFKKTWKSLLQLKLDGIIYDESHHHFGIQSHLHKASIKYSQARMPKFVYALTGTPYLSTNYNILAAQRILGRKSNWLTFTNKYFDRIRLGRSSRFIRKPKPGSEQQMIELLKDMGSIIKKSECLDLPDQLFIKEEFTLTGEQEKAIKELEEYPTMSTPIVLYSKVHQIVGGTLKDKYDKIKSEKLDRLKEIVKLNNKVVVVARYNLELDMIEKELKDIGINVFVMNGKTENRQELIDKVNSLDKCVFIVNAAISEGYSLTSFSLMVFYSIDFSLKNRVQMIGRIHRYGQENKCTYIDMVTRDTVDEAVHKSMERKEDFDIELYCKKIIDRQTY